jgi:hypothetical protein
MKKTAIVGVAASLCLLGSGTALATAHHPAEKKHYLKTVKLSTYKPASGQTVKGTASPANPKGNYVCIFSAYKPGAKLSASDSNTSSVQLNLKVKHGKVSCSNVFLPFTTPSGHHCPPSKADKKAGWSCGLAFADQDNRTDYKVGVFKF